MFNITVNFFFNRIYSNLGDKMRQRNVKNQDEILSSSNKYIEEPEQYKGKWKSGKYKEVHLEIGIGKGAFIANKALMHSDVLYVGIELNKGVTSLAIKKIARFEEENNIVLDNLKILSFDALNLGEIFKQNEVDKIYLNFSDPWPKTRHEKRRLTSDVFLNVYKNILKENGKIEFKTDNRFLFEYTIKNINKNKMKIEYLSLDLHKDIETGRYKDKETNVLTEYEEKFSKLGPIYKCIINF